MRISSYVCQDAAEIQNKQGGGHAESRIVENLRGQALQVTVVIGIYALVARDGSAMHMYTQKSLFIYGRE